MAGLVGAGIAGYQLKLHIDFPRHQFMRAAEEGCRNNGIDLGEVYMLSKTFIVWVFMLFFATITQAQERGFGLGVIVGEPSGISGKSWLSKKTAFAGAVAWSLEREEALHVHLDHLFHDFDSMPVEQGTLAWYYGFGGRIKFSDKSMVSVRIPVGLNYLFENAPVDLFLEIVPMLDLIPNTEFNFNGGVGIRYFFNKR